MNHKVHTTSTDQITLLIDKRDPDCFDNEVEQAAAMTPEEAVKLAESLVAAATEVSDVIYTVERVDINAMSEREMLDFLPEVGE